MNGFSSSVALQDHSYNPSKKHQPYALDARDYQLIHTHSEWLDSNSSLSSPNKPNMSVTIAEERPQTPIKKGIVPMITPVSENKQFNIKIDEKYMSRSSSASPVIKEKTVDVATMDVFWSMLNNITGKDKMAKVGQYLLRLLIHHASEAKDYLSDNVINADNIAKRYNDRSKQLNLLTNLIKHPYDFARIAIIFFTSAFVRRFEGVVKGLAMYRQFLRFGKSPFKLREIVTTLLTTVRVDKYGAIAVHNLDTTVLNRSFLGALIGLYYSFNDECLLLYKLGVLKNKTFRKFVARHEALAWYYDSILGIYNAIENLNDLNTKEMELKIQIQVKNKAKVLSRQILGAGASGKNLSDSSILFDYIRDNSNSADVSELKLIQFKKTNAWIDLFKWSSDLIFDSYTVFHWKLPFPTFQIWFGISASTLSTLKVFRETRKSLLEKVLRAANK